jgi:hypothetical protein
MRLQIEDSSELGIMIREYMIVKKMLKLLDDKDKNFKSHLSTQIFEKSGVDINELSEDGEFLALSNDDMVELQKWSSKHTSWGIVYPAFKAEVVAAVNLAMNDILANNGVNTLYDSHKEFISETLKKVLQTVDSSFDRCKIVGTKSSEGGTVLVKTMTKDIKNEEVMELINKAEDFSGISVKKSKT